MARVQAYHWALALGDPSVAVAYQIAGKILYLKASGHFDTETLVAVFSSAMLDPAWDPPMRILMDNRDSDERASSSELRDRVERIANFPELFQPRIAVVVSDALHYGLARMAGVFSERHDIQVHVTDDLQEAKEWIEGDA